MLCKLVVLEGHSASLYAIIDFRVVNFLIRFSIYFFSQLFTVLFCLTNESSVRIDKEKFLTI